MVRSTKVLKLCFVILFAQLRAADDVQPHEDGPTDQWCPNANEIAPCVCTWDEVYNLFLDCSAATTIDELSNAFKVQFPIENFHSLTILQEGCTNCSLTILPTGVLGNSVTFEEITIGGTQLEDIEEQVFRASQPTLITLRLSSNQLRSFPSETMQLYDSLAYLYLNNNKFTAMNPIHHIASENLIIINLSSNDFPVPPDFLANSPAVKQVRMRNMGMTEVPIYDDSPIGMFTGLQHIELIDFGANFITEIQTDTIVAEAATLKTVDFSQNNISILHPAFISGFSAESDVTLNMSRNSISRLDQAVWEDILTEIPQEYSVDISQNPLLCGCDIAWLVSSPLMNSLTDTTTCENGTPVKDLSEDAFTDC